jgi:hypothetical protein
MSFQGAYGVELDSHEKENAPKCPFYGLSEPYGRLWDNPEPPSGLTGLLTKRQHRRFMASLVRAIEHDARGRTQITRPPKRVSP